MRGLVPNRGLNPSGQVPPQGDQLLAPYIMKKMERELLLNLTYEQYSD